ncbi:uncharacterized protein LOC107369026 isoform X2 [Tetranychus urticae]|uniref:uncharacterized protein LOC107369026 isoform X2 n=1 Tax=Tetranychus urticae TaxID=32264 RepID=UPI000D657851|nr:uncharacterized protein LOC107369026 isoform X2 [Tetranychus urticae]
MLLIQFKINKMLVKFSIIFLSISTLITGRIMPDAPELLDLPLKVSDGVLLIDASFHNSSYPFGRIFSVREMILVSESAITGKIQVWNNEDGYDIHYQFDRSGKDSKERLVIHDKDCTLYNHSEMIQNAHLFGDNKPLRDLIMMTGPSIIYRFAGQSAVWSEATQHGLSRKLNTTVVSYSTFVITLDFHNTYDFSPGAKQFQIEFKGYDQVSESHGQRLLMDIYLHRSFTPIQISDLKYKTQPSPGIGCPNYLIPSERKPIPKLLAKYVNFTMYEEIEGSTNNRPFSEITASVQSLLMRLKTNLNGVKTEVIYDHRHGIALTLEEGGRCQIAISNNNSPGLDVMFRFRLENLFFVDGDFNYLRKDYFVSNFTNSAKVDRFEFLVDAWESVQFNVDFQGNKVDKIVFTHFFVESPNSTIFAGYSLVQTMISIYNSHSSKKSYVLAKRIRRSYVYLQSVQTKYEIYDYLNDCKYLLRDRRVTLSFKIGCQVRNTDCVKLANRCLVRFKEEFIDAMLIYEPISQLRIDDIQYRSSDSQIEMKVTFLSKPDYDDLINPQKMLVSNETFDVARTLSASNESECLYQLGHIRGLFAVGIWRSSDSFCGYLRKFEDFKEDNINGDSCNVYIFPLEKYYPISYELSRNLALDDRQKGFLKYMFRTFSMKDPLSHDSVSYKIIDIVEVTEFAKDGKDSKIPLYHRIYDNSKLKKDEKTILVGPGIATFTECLRFCLNSKELNCSSFSFCSDSDSVDCRISALIENNVTEAANKERDTKCSIFSINALRLYSKVPNRKFKKQISTAIRQSATSCAQECLHSDDCISFQDCGYSCSFNSFYTDSSSEYDEDCVIYYREVLHEYRNTGNKIVSEVIHTEMNLNLDQCASLCHGWTDGDTGCRSFNYCPRNINQMESSCSLTKYSVAISDTNSIEGGHCFNYELITQSNDKKNEESSALKLTKGTSELNSFGIIMMFLIIVSFLVFSAPCVYEKIKPKRLVTQVNESFTCTKQVNEQPETTNLNMSTFKC